jgi:plasmid stabilization system protein ParE
MLKSISAFPGKKYSTAKAKETKQLIKDTLLKKLCKSPDIAPVSQRLLDLGIRDYRQYLIGQNNIVFYRVDDANKKIILLAVMDSRQSIQKLLSEILLLS